MCVLDARVRASARDGCFPRVARRLQPTRVPNLGGNRTRKAPTALSGSCAQTTKVRACSVRPKGHGTMVTPMKRLYASAKAIRVGEGAHVRELAVYRHDDRRAHRPAAPPSSGASPTDQQVARATDAIGEPVAALSHEEGHHREGRHEICPPPAKEGVVNRVVAAHRPCAAEQDISASAQTASPFSCGCFIVPIVPRSAGFSYAPRASPCKRERRVYRAGRGAQGVGANELAHHLMAIRGRERGSRDAQ